MARSISLIACIVLAGAIAWAASRTPSPAPERPGQFSAQRAMADVQAIGARPHPIGSADHDHVRDYLVRRFAGLGLQTTVWRGQALERDLGGREAFIEGGTVQDIIAILPGASHTLPAVAVMAHYDSVPSSPGAADDSVGVAAALEIAGKLQSLGQPDRDVIFLITDGEEAGLLGARAFFAGHPLARRIGAVLNMESAGGGGRAYMFETGPANGAMIDLYRRATATPSASSLTGYVYSLMDNDTDFTVSKRLGIAGFNFAFFGRPFDYHAASSTPAVTEAGSLQHIGDQVLAAARALAFTAALPARRADPVYQDLLGVVLIAYPIWAGWLILAGAAGLSALALARAFRQEPLRALDAARGALALLLSFVLAAGLLWVTRALTGASADFVLGKALMARFGLYEAALAAACAATALLSFKLMGGGAARYWSAFAGGFLFILLLAAALQAVAPLVGFLLAWPLLAAAAVAVVLAWGWKGERTRPAALAIAALLCILPLAETFHLAHVLVLAVGAGIPEVLALPTLIAVLLLFPLLWPTGERGTPALCLGALAIALGLALFIRVADPWSARHPRPTQALYVADFDTGGFFRVSPLRPRDAWTHAVLAADGGPEASRDLLPFAFHVAAAPARPVSIAGPKAAMVRDAAGRVTIRLAPGGPGRQLRLDVQAAGAISGLTVNGLATAPSTGASWTHIVWDAPPPEGIIVTFTAPAGALQARYGQLTDGWPPDARPLPPRPPDAMPWMNTDATAVVGSVPVSLPKPAE